MNEYFICKLELENQILTYFKIFNYVINTNEITFMYSEST